ncbi:MAG: AmmeMemoRadiSam system protein B [Victivallaceae bacterium]
MKYRFTPGSEHLSVSLGARSSRTLASTIAGSWYPGNRTELVERIETHLASAEVPAFAANILILPHAGMVYSGAVAAYGIKTILNANFKRVILLAPSHRVWQPDVLIAPEADRVSTPLGEIPVDREALDRLAARFSVLASDAVHAAEHSTQIQYPMLQYALKDFAVLPLIVSSLDRDGVNRAAAALRSLIDAKTLLVVSSDFTHYGADFRFEPFKDDVRHQVRKLDLVAFELIRQRDGDGFTAFIERTGATICGAQPIRLMLATIPEKTEFKLLRYATSADDDGDDSRFVCYLAAAGFANWEPEAASDSDFLSPADKRALLDIARTSIRQALEHGVAPDPARFAARCSEAMRREAGCFVTLTDKTSHQLRGCIGEIQAFRPLVEAVCARAVDSAFRDPRFPALTPAEFDRVSIEISVLTPEKAVASWRDIVIGKHGMTIHKSGRSAVFLPQVAPEQGWDLATTLTYLAQKAGLRPDDWREGARFTVFEAIVFNEDEFTS